MFVGIFLNYAGYGQKFSKILVKKCSTNVHVYLPLSLFTQIAGEKSFHQHSASGRNTDDKETFSRHSTSVSEVEADQNFRRHFAPENKRLTQASGYTGSNLCTTVHLGKWQGDRKL